jgi:hypothetical protein
MIKLWGRVAGSKNRRRVKRDGSTSTVITYISDRYPNSNNIESRFYQMIGDVKAKSRRRCS